VIHLFTTLSSQMACNRRTCIPDFRDTPQ